MTKPNDLKDILRQAVFDASKPDMDEVWDDVLMQLDEQLPIKKKKRRFLFIFFFLSAITAFSGVILIVKNSVHSDTKLSSNKSEPAVENSTIKGQQMPYKEVQQLIEKPVNSHTTIRYQKHENEETKIAGRKTSPQNQFQAYQAYQQTPEKPLAKRVKSALDKPANIFTENMLLDTQHEEINKSVLVENNNIFRRSLSLADLHPFEILDKLYDLPLELMNGFASLNKKDSVTPKNNDETDDTAKRQKRKFSVGGTLAFNFNNFTTAENRLSGKFVNGVYQVGKQMGVNLYARMPITQQYQVQAELGFEPYSTNIQINYRTVGQTVFSRYNLHRMVYSQLGFSNYLEIRKDLYLHAGIYYALAMPVYGAQLDRVNQGANQSEEVLSSTYERRDFRKNVFDLRRHDFGFSGGIEYHIKRLSTGLRFYRGLTDVTPETPSLYHNFSISLRLGYHFEFK